MATARKSCVLALAIALPFAIGGCAMAQTTHRELEEPPSFSAPFVRTTISATPNDATARSAETASATPVRVVATPPDPRSVSGSKPLARELSHGDEGEDVRELQIRLRHAKSLAAYDANIYFDDATKAGVVKFQNDNELNASGTVDQATWDALLGKSYDPTPEEMSNTDIGPWFIGPSNETYMMELQHRLQQVKLYDGPINGEHTDEIKEASSAYRTSKGLPASEVMDERIWQMLYSETSNPSYDVLHEQPPAPGDVTAQELDPRCLTGATVCVSLDQRLLTYVVDGQPVLTRDVRFGRPGYDTPPTEKNVWHTDENAVSVIFGERIPIPYSMFYDGDFAVHFSDEFADFGYGEGSHGCVNLKDYQAAKWLFEQVGMGGHVVVY